MPEKLGKLIPFRREMSPEMKAAAIQRLADLDTQLEPLQREAEGLRRKLGLLAFERGVDDDHRAIVFDLPPADQED